MSTARESLAIAQILSGVEIARDGVLQVHSAFRGLSHQGYRAEDFLDAMLTRLGGRTLLMPTMTWRIVTPAHPVFDAATTPSHTGVLTEIFRTQHAQARSLHPTHSVAGHGPDAAWLLDGHHLGDTPCPAESPYGRMRQRDSWILLLGVGLESCTAIHHVEELVAPEIYVRPASEAEAYTCRDLRGRSHELRTRRHLRLDRDFPKFEPMLDPRRGTIGDTPWRLLRLGNLYDVVHDALALRADGTLRSVDSRQRATG
jgi:aminoglycoside 3-N-acetyltransferase